MNLIKIDEIKKQWYRLKSEYEEEYNEDFFTDFYRYSEYLEKMRNFLIKLKCKNPENVDIICTLASVELELRYGSEEYIKLLEDFLEDFGEKISDNDKARIYTNMAYVEDYSKKALEYLEISENLQSNFIETYIGLSLFYFSEYRYHDDMKDVKTSQRYLDMSRMYIEKALKIDDGYICKYNYAAALFELGHYDGAKEILLKLHQIYPEKNILILNLAYCETKLGNKNMALSYLETIVVKKDDECDIERDSIVEERKYDVYYELGEYDTYLSYWKSKNLDDYYTIDWKEYFYALWHQNKKTEFELLEEKNRDYLNTVLNEDMKKNVFDSEEEKKECIDYFRNIKKEFEEMVSSIKNGCSKPDVKLEMDMEFVCFMIDCIRHKQRLR